MATDTNYRPGIRQLHIHRSLNERVRRLAAMNGEPMAAVFARLAKSAATREPADDPLVKQRIVIEDPVMEQLRARAKAERSTLAELLEQEIESMGIVGERVA